MEECICEMVAEIPQCAFYMVTTATKGRHTGTLHDAHLCHEVVDMHGWRAAGVLLAESEHVSLRALQHSLMDSYTPEEKRGEEKP